jgi:uncharacterized protein
MYARLLKPLGTSFFLFGPRGTGKSSWLEAAYTDAVRFDFLRNEVLLRYLGEPERFRREVEGLPKGAWVVLDEVQKVPALLDAVHAVMQARRNEIKFCMTGSSARKLRHGNANLLAGRAVQRSFFPLVSVELGDEFDLELCLRFGTLPLVWVHPEGAVGTLEAYVGTYLKEEIQQEALARNLQTFTRFLKVAALMNGQVTNVAGVARDAGIARTSVERHFEVLFDTLIGFWVPGWQPRIKVRERQSPKFYFFDCGVVRAILGTLRDPLDSTERGVMFETFTAHQLRAAMSYLDTGGELSYYRTPAGVEVDFIWTRGKHAIGFEVKSGTEWRREYGKGLLELLANKSISAAYGIYRGDRTFSDSGIKVLSFQKFSDLLFDRKVLP